MCAILGQINKNDLVVFEKRQVGAALVLNSLSQYADSQQKKKISRSECFKVGGRRRCVTVRQIQ